MEDITKKLSELLSTPEGMDKIKTMMALFMDSGSSSNNTKKTEQETFTPESHEDVEEEPIAKIAPISKPIENNTLGFNFNNPEMLLKLSSVMETLNSKDDSRVNLLMSLKPFLGQKRGAKLDQAVKMLQISKVSNIFKK